MRATSPCATENIETVVNKAAALSSSGTRATTFRHKNSPTTVGYSQSQTHKDIGLLHLYAHWCYNQRACAIINTNA